MFNRKIDYDLLQGTVIIQSTETIRRCNLMGCIYIVTNQIINNKLGKHKQYVGKTYKTMPDRWYEHRQNAKLMIKARYDPDFDQSNEHYQKIKNSILYKAMCKYGIENFIIEEVEFIDDTIFDDFDTFLMYLNESEVQYIIEFDTLTPNGYNSTTGGDGGSKHNEESIKLMKKKKRENLNNTRHPAVQDMPAYVTYTNPETSKKDEAVLIQKHPLINNKVFTVKKYGSLDAAKRACREFIDAQEKLGTPLVSKRKNAKVIELDEEFKPDDIEIKPAEIKVKEKRIKRGDVDDYPGLKYTDKGYELDKWIRGKHYNKSFGNKPNSRENAIEYYKQLTLDTTSET